jgi:hypothetical protein
MHTGRRNRDPGAGRRGPTRMIADRAAVFRCLLDHARGHLT